MKRSILVGAAASFCVVLAAACSGGTDTNDDGNDDTLTIWHYFRAEGQLDALEEQNELFKEAYPDVKLDVVTVPADQVVRRLLATASTQEGPDVLFDNVVVDFPPLAGSGVLYDLTSHWSDYDDADQFPENATWEYDDATYNVMSYTNLLGLYYNEDALDEVGIEPPTTIEELDTALQEVDEDGTYTPIIVAGDPGVTTAWAYFPILLGEGVDYCNITEDDAEYAFDYVEDWADNGYIPRDASAYDQTDAWQPFMTGDYAFAINGNWNLGDVEDADFEVGTVRYPAGSQASRVFPGGEGIAIGAFAESPDLAWGYIETAFLSQEGSEINFDHSGQIPMRADVADDIDFESRELVEPFVDAATETGAWPSNEKTGEMQEQFGEAVSSVLSGQATATDAAHAAVTGIEDAREEGGGDC